MLPKELEPYKEYIYTLLFLFVVGIIAYGSYAMTRPPEGTWRYGVCKTFLQQYIRYPKTLHILNVREAQTFAKVEFNSLNAHGFRPTQNIKCSYKQEKGVIILEEIRIDRGKLKQKAVDSFNRSISILLALEEQNTTLPPPFAYTFEGLKR